MKRFKSPEHAHVFWKSTISWLPTFDQNDICFLPRTSKRNDSSGLQHGSVLSLPDLTCETDIHPAYWPLARL